jgi:mannose-6-phosphate isomerase-like protein (cupin superfamily)
MNRGACVAAVLALAAVLPAAALAQNAGHGPRPGGHIPEPKVRGYIRPVDVAAFPAVSHSEFVAGPNSGLDSAWLVLTQVPAGGSGPPLHTHPADQFYFVLDGKMNVQLGTERFTAGPNTLVMIPAGTPHRTWNTTSAYERHVELIAPPPPSETLVSPAEPRAIANAAALVRPAAAFAVGASGIQSLADRATGSATLAVSLVQEQPGAGEKALHIHPVDQAYFVIDGTLTVQIGLKQYHAGPNTYVVIPAGVVHRAWNAGPGVVRSLDLMLPEPAGGEAAEVPVTLDR